MDNNNQNDTKRFTIYYPVLDLNNSKHKLIDKKKIKIIFKKEKENLLEENNNKLTKKFKDILIEWFNKFSNEGIMDIENIIKFIKDVTKTEISEKAIKIKDFLRKYSKNKKFLKRYEFLDYYLIRCKEAEPLVWKNIQNMNYYNKLLTLEINIFDDNKEICKFNLNDSIDKIKQNYKDSLNEEIFECIQYLSKDDKYFDILNNNNISYKFTENEYKNNIYRSILIQNIIEDIFINEESNNNKYSKKDLKEEKKKKKEFFINFIKNSYYDLIDYISYKLKEINENKDNEKLEEIIIKCCSRGIEIINIIHEIYFKINFDDDKVKIFNKIMKENKLENIIEYHEQYNNLIEQIIHFIDLHYLKYENKTLNNGEIILLIKNCYYLLFYLLHTNTKTFEFINNKEEIKHLFNNLVKNILIIDKNENNIYYIEILLNSYLENKQNNFMLSEEYLSYLIKLSFSIFEEKDDSLNLFSENIVYKYFSNLFVLSINKKCEEIKNYLIQFYETIYNYLKEKIKDFFEPNNEDLILHKCLSLLNKCLDNLKIDKEFRKELISKKVNNSETLYDLLINKLILEEERKIEMIYNNKEIVNKDNKPDQIISDGNPNNLENVIENKSKENNEMKIKEMILYCSKFLCAINDYEKINEIISKLKEMKKKEEENYNNSNMNNSSNNITEEVNKSNEKNNIKLNGDNKIINFNNYLIQILIGLLEESSFNIIDYYEHFNFYEDLLNILSNTIICSIYFDNKENKSNEKNIHSIITVFKKILIPLISNENKDILNDSQRLLLINFIKEHLFIDEYIKLVFIDNNNKEISNQFYELLSIIIIKINKKEENEKLYKHIYKLINDENKITDSLYNVLFVFIKNMNIEEFNTTKEIFMSLYNKLLKEKDLDNLNIIGEILEYFIFDKKILNKEEDIMEEIKLQFNYELMEIIFNASINFLILISKQMQANNENITNDFIYNYIQKLYRYCEKNNSKYNRIKIVKFIYGILEINDIFTPNRVHSLLGYPTLIIKKDKNSILPLLGIKLMNSNIDQEIFEYINYNHIRKNRCILSILFPSSYEINEKDNNCLDENDRLDLIYELIEVSLGFNKIKEGNYYLFKYLYLMQSRTIKYNNLYEEIKQLLENANKNNNNKYDLTKFKNNEKKCIELINYETNSMNFLIDLNSSSLSNTMNEKNKYNTKPELPDCLKASNVILNEKKNKDYIGLISDIVPDEIGKININLIASNDNLSIFKFEYFLTYFTKKELLTLSDEKKDFIYKNIRRNAIEKNNIIDNNIINLDISTLKEKSDEEFLKYINENLKEKKKIIIENKEILENKIIKSCLIRYYILSQSKDSVFKINIRMNEMPKDIESNFYIPNIIYDYVEKNKSNNIINIHRIKNKLKFLENNSIGTTFSNINYEKYFNDYIN